MTSGKNSGIHGNNRGNQAKESGLKTQEETLNLI